jgi:formate dehydrogenase subunit beta
MIGVWSLKTHGDPLGKLRLFITQLWSETSLDGMLVIADGENEVHSIPRYITDVNIVKKINPFKPLMEINAARLIPELLALHPREKIGALLRPCEIRALFQMARHASISLDNLLTISVDCLGTFPADEYQWRLKRIEDNNPASERKSTDRTNELAAEALKFARQGGIVPYRYRAACQVCASPATEHANINIHIFGLPVRQQLTIMVNEHAFMQHVRIETLLEKEADQELLTQRERLLSKINERHQRTMERVEEGLGSLLPADLDAFLSQIESCGECQICMDICPICSIDKPRRLASGQYERSDVLHWLISCVGCGMCEQSCPKHLPIYSIFAHIRRNIDLESGYPPG